MIENQNKLHIRRAKKTELEWVNQCYDQAGFIHSNFEKEVIAIAEWEGQKAGLGRLVQIDTQNLELGGMYVLEPFRGKGIAKELVKFLLSHVKPLQKVYCIPFEHLLPFYRECGFDICQDLEQAPQKLVEKLLWCKKAYPHPTLLLKLN